MPFFILYLFEGLRKHEYGLIRNCSYPSFSHLCFQAKKTSSASFVLTVKLSQCFLLLLFFFSAVFPTLRVESLWSGSSLQWVLDPSCVPVSAVLITLLKAFSPYVTYFTFVSLECYLPFCYFHWALRQHYNSSIWHLCHQQTLQSSYLSPFLVNMLKNWVSSRPPSARQFHGSFPLSFCLSAS